MSDIEQGLSFDGSHLSLVGLDLVSLPSQIGEKYGDKVKQLDLSYNALEQLNNLERFVHLNSLVVDNNNLENDNNFPKIEGLKTLSVNNNKISDLKRFLDAVRVAFPNLTYLSMLKNPACTNEFTGRDDSDYQRYRYYVLHTLRGLRFLDSRQVDEAERREAWRVGSHCLPARPDPEQYRRPAPKEPEEANATPVAELPPDLKQEGIGKASFGLSNYVYYGRQSEGNRFIMNDDL